MNEWIERKKKEEVDNNKDGQQGWQSRKTDFEGGFKQFVNNVRNWSTNTVYKNQYKSKVWKKPNT